LATDAGQSAIRDRVAAARARIAVAAERAGRLPADVRIVAVTKTLSPETVAAALAAGLQDIGENYVQEARAKREAAGGKGCWHLIGGLQRNKVRAAVAVFDRIDSVDSSAVASAVSSAAQAAGRTLPVLLEVNLGGEASKRGIRPEGVEGLARDVLGLPGLVLEGLMAIPPLAAEAEATRPYFRSLRELRDRTATRVGVELPHLSMGMSNDFAVAVEEGATWVRLGRALFEVRGPGAWRPGSSWGGQGS
jgi:pyridoxal phosphate enzyme (YggS family)